MSASDEKKPSLPSSHVTLKISTQDDRCVYFRVKRDVELRKMMEAFSIKNGIEMGVYRFLFDGHRIQPYQTPNELEDGDEIQAFLEQLSGGCSFCYRY